MQSIAIDDLKLAEALLAGERRLLEMVATGEPLADVLHALCNIAEATGSGVHCSILLIDSDAKFHFGAGPSVPPGYAQAVEDVPVMPEVGPCGMAASLKLQVVVDDLVVDPRWQPLPWHAAAVKFGLRSACSTPIFARSGEVLGTFAMYHEQAGSPSPIDQTIIQQFTHIASIAIERAQREAALKRSEAFLAEAQRLSSTGSFLWRVSTGEMTWSEETYRIFEFDPKTRVTLELISSRYHPDDLPLFYQWVARASREAQDLEAEPRLRMGDGSIKYVHTLAHASRNERGELEYIGAVQDVTERRRSEDALNKVRSELAHVARVTTLGALTASITHEVNQPLSGIVTNASTSLRMLADDPPNLEGARETARRTIRDANRASEVIARLRALFGKKALVMERVDLNEAIREVVALAASEFQRDRVAIRSELATDLPSTQGDRVQLQQVVLNLMRNARDAMLGTNGELRSVVIKTACDDGGLRLTVTDSGVGVESLERIFDAFYSTKSNGMGIGLWVSRSIIESHRGRIWAEPNEGPGTTFGLWLPRVECSFRS
jgi:signal transduction histidine kinase